MVRTSWWNKTNRSAPMDQQFVYPTPFLSHDFQPSWHAYSTSTSPSLTLLSNSDVLIPIMSILVYTSQHSRLVTLCKLFILTWGVTGDSLLADCGDLSCPSVIAGTCCKVKYLPLLEYVGVVVQIWDIRCILQAVYFKDEKSTGHVTQLFSFLTSVNVLKGYDNKT